MDIIRGATQIDHFLCNGMGESIGYNQKEGSQEVFQTGIALVFHLFDQDRSLEFLHFKLDLNQKIKDFRGYQMIHSAIQSKQGIIGRKE